MPDLIIEDVKVDGSTISKNGSAPGTFALGSEFSVTYDVRNLGTKSAGSSTAAVFMSVNGVLTRLDTNPTSSLTAGSQDTNETLSFSIPTGLTPGAHAIVIQADYNGLVSETNESNNGFGFIINVVAPQPPDLIIEDVIVAGQSISRNEVVTTSFAPGEAFSVTYDVRNIGTGSAGSSTAAVFMNVNGTLTRLATNSTTSLSAGSQDTNETLSFNIPAGLAPGGHAVVVQADDGNSVSESNESNNSFAFVINVAAPQLPDLMIEDVIVAGQSISPNGAVTTSFMPGETFSVTYDVRNIGTGSAGSSTAAVFMSVNGVLTRLDTNSTTALSAGSQDTNQTLNFTIPAGLAPGAHAMVIQADYNGLVSESNDSNNGFGFSITIGNEADSVREGTDTSATLAVGAWQSGVINAEPISGDGLTFDRSGGYVDKDWYRVNLSKGRIYTFDGRSVSLSEGNVTISLYDQSGQRIQNIYGSGSADYVQGSAPSFRFDASRQTNATQTYYLAVSAGGPDPDWRTATGKFDVRLTDNGAVSSGPSTFTLSPATLNVLETAGTASFTIARTNNVGSETVWVSTVPTQGFANSGDYIGQDTVPYTFANGVSSITVPIRIIDDLAPEANETFAVWVQRNETDPFGTFAARSTFTIIDNETGSGPQTFSLASDATSVTENNTTITFTVTRSGTTLPEATVYYSTLAGSASSLYGRDYEGAVSQPVIFSEGSNTSRPFTITIREDQIDENNETFDVMIGLSSSDGRSKAVAIKQITIIDDDTSGGQSPTISDVGTGAISTVGSLSNVFQMSPGTPNTFSISTSSNIIVNSWTSSNPNIVSSSLVITNGTSAKFAVSTTQGFSGPVFVSVQNYRESNEIAEDLLVDIIADAIEASFDAGKILNGLQAYKQSIEYIDASSTYSLFEKLEGRLNFGFNVLSQILDISSRVDNIVKAPDPWARYYAEIMDMVAGSIATVGGSVFGGLVGFLTGANIGLVGGSFIGGTFSGIIYEAEFLGESISDKVIDWSLENWREGTSGFAQAVLSTDTFSFLQPRLLSNALIEYKVNDSSQIELGNLLVDEAYYLNTYPEARVAIQSGSVSNALAYFIKFGIASGNIANANASPLDASSVASYIASFDPMSFGTPAVFTSASGVLAGDALSADEHALAVLVNARRGAGATLVFDNELTALANRVARDWMDNNPNNALLAQDGGDPTTWIQTLSNGENFRNAFDGVNWTNVVLDNGVRVAGAISGAATAPEAFALFAATAAGAAFMSDANSRSIGVAEYAGLWIIVTSDATLQNDATVSTELVIAHQFGSDSAEVMFAGTGPGNARLGGGSDTYFGGLFNDSVRGEAGDDQLFGGAGDDTLDGGLGVNVIDGGAGTDTLVLSDTSVRPFLINGQVEVFGVGERHRVTNIELVSIGGQVQSWSSYAATALDPLAYVASYADLIAGFRLDATAAASHYVTSGLAEGRTITFDASIYLAKYADVRTGFGNDTAQATRHFITNGFNEGRSIDLSGNDTLTGSAGNDALSSGAGDDTLDGGRGINQIDGGAGTDTLVLSGMSPRPFLIDGEVVIYGVGEQNRVTNIELVSIGGQVQSWSSYAATALDPYAYIASHADLIAGFRLDAAFAASHYVTSGLGEGRGITFDANIYLSKYGDLRAAFGSDTVAATKHYITSGFAEGRSLDLSGNDIIIGDAGDDTLDGGPGINVIDGGAGTDTLVLSGLSPTPFLIDGQVVIYGVGEQNRVTNIELVSIGGQVQSWSSYAATALDPYAYIASHADLIAGFRLDAAGAASHYVTSGIGEGRGITFDANIYLSKYSDLRAAFGSDTVAATKHYITSGFAEGRSLDQLPQSSQAALSDAIVMKDTTQDDLDALFGIAPSTSQTDDLTQQWEQALTQITEGDDKGSANPMIANAITTADPFSDNTVATPGNIQPDLMLYTGQNLDHLLHEFVV